MEKKVFLGIENQFQPSYESKGCQFIKFISQDKGIINDMKKAKKCYIRTVIPESI